MSFATLSVLPMNKAYGSWHRAYGFFYYVIIDGLLNAIRIHIKEKRKDEIRTTTMNLSIIIDSESNHIKEKIPPIMDNKPTVGAAGYPNTLKDKGLNELLFLKAITARFTKP